MLLYCQSVNASSYSYPCLNLDVPRDIVPVSIIHSHSCIPVLDSRSSARRAYGAALALSCACHTMQSKYAAAPLLQLSRSSIPGVLVFILSSRIRLSDFVPRRFGLRFSSLGLRSPLLFRHPPKDSSVPPTLQSKHAAMPLLQLSTFPVTASVGCPFSFLVSSLASISAPSPHPRLFACILRPRISVSRLSSSCFRLRTLFTSSISFSRPRSSSHALALRLIFRLVLRRVLLDLRPVLVLIFAFVLIPPSRSSA